MQVRVAFVLAVLAVFVVPGFTACSDNGTGVAPFSSGVDPAKPLSGLDMGDLDRLCGALRGWLDARRVRSGQISCQASAVAAARGGATSDEMVRANCKRLYSECEMKRVMRESNSSDNAVMCNRPPSTCSVTVGQYETCLNDTGAELEKALGQVPTCDSLTLAPPQQPAQRPSTRVETPASCAQLSAACGQPGSMTQLPGSTSSGAGASEPR